MSAALSPGRSRGLLTYFVMLVAGVTWGATFSLQKIVMASPVADAFAVTAWQGLIGLTVGVLIARVQGHWPRFDAEHWRFYFILGLLGTAVPNTLFYIAAPHLPAGVLALSVTTVPMLTYLGALAWRLESFAVLRAVGLLFGLAAVLLVLLPDTSLPDKGQALWLLPALLASLCYAIEAIYVTFNRPPSSNGIALIACAQGMSSLMLLPVLLLTGSSMPLDWPPDRHEVALLLMAASSVVAYALYLYMVQTAGAVFASQVGYVVTLMGVGWGMLLFREQHSLWVWAAIVLLMVGVALVQPRARRA